MSENSTEALRLISKLLEQEICQSDFERLNELLEDDPAARSLYIQSLYMHDQLSDLVLSELPTSDSTRFAERTATSNLLATDGESRSLSVLVAGGILVATLVAIASWAIFRLGESSRPEELVAQSPVLTETLDPNVAVVTDVINAVWAESSPLNAGDGAGPGLIRLESGMLRLEFYCGAAVILEGPAELELKSSTLAVLEAGRLRAHVPPEARGFTILSRGHRVVDQGTEFGIIASPDGETQVHVFEGLVDLFPDSGNSASSRPLVNSDVSSPQRLSTGGGLRIQADGERKDIVAEDTRFVSFIDFADLVEQSIVQRRDEWRKYKQALQRDDRVYAWFDFDHELMVRRRVRGSVPSSNAFSGALVGCRLASGRWPEETSLEFKHPGDRVRLSLPDEFDSVTLVAWVRVDGLDRSFSGLLMANDHTVGKPHWQINRQGRIVFRIAART